MTDFFKFLSKKSKKGHMEKPTPADMCMWILFNQFEFWVKENKIIEKYGSEF